MEIKKPGINEELNELIKKHRNTELYMETRSAQEWIEAKYMSGKRTCKYYSVCGSIDNCGKCTGFEKVEKRNIWDWKHSDKSESKDEKKDNNTRYN